MIQVRLNGMPCAVDLAQCGHLGELIGVCSQHIGDHIVTKVRVNGCDIPEESLDRLEAFPLEGIHIIEIATRDPREIACSSLEGAVEYAEEVRRSLLEAADHLRAGRIEDANRLTAETSDALTVLLYAVTTAARILGEAGDSLRGFDADILPWIEQVVGAQKGRDWLRVADTLEYEIAERVQIWSRECSQVRIAVEGMLGDEAVVTH